MKERPILFSAPMIRAILDGRKTITRRVVKPQPRFTDPQHQSVDPPNDGNEWTWWAGNVTQGIYHEARCPYGKPGDRLWVRESGWERPHRTFKMLRDGADTWERYYYDADGYKNEGDKEQFKQWGFKRRPSIHMPRWASRIDLEITGIRVERLQDISEADAAAEGVTREDSDVGRIYWHDSRSDWSKDPRHAYEQLWQSINGPQSWEANPWVWVIEFKRLAA